MSIVCERWGRGRDFEHPFRGTPYDDVVAKQTHLWFVVEDASQVVMGFELAGCKWRLIESYTSDRPESEGTDIEYNDPEGWTATPLDKSDPLYCLVYERVGAPPKCGGGG